MEMVVLVGISRRALDSLIHSPRKTLELRSARNIEALSHVKTGDRVFLTYDTFHDVTKGTGGIIAEVLHVESMEQRLPWEESDEREVMVCRVQLRLRGLGKVVELERKDGVIRALVREMLPHEMAMG
ncbi:DUF473 domain-containing protein [Palaeococcus ferrophilus]|uniref:DUF473 domain-containing protein n=1 Tax=Palaeococcus ferrophilus TaxID=83868 RepID=UPI00064FDAB8|nr:DUF473 domain-containing protein [Palaeococcus ferrophilus]